MNTEAINDMWAAVEDDDSQEMFKRLGILADAYEEDGHDEFAKLLRACAELKKRARMGIIEDKKTHEWSFYGNAFASVKQSPQYPSHQASIAELFRVYRLNATIQKTLGEYGSLLKLEWVKGSPTKRRSYEYLLEFMQFNQQLQNGSKT